jgi:hypothetical protein
MGELGKIILIILLSSVKFVAGPPFAYYDQQYEFTFFETVFYCVLGGMLGVVAFSFFSKPLFTGWHWLVAKFKKRKIKEEPFSPLVVDVDEKIEVHYEYVEKQNPQKKLFTKRNRNIVKVWKKYGLYGIAFLTPVILSIPIGTIIANSLVSNRKKVILYMFVSLVFWSILMTSLFEAFHAASVKDLQEQIIK